NYHPKLVQLHGVCLQNSPICLVFEFMESGCLSDYLKKQRGSLSKEELLGMCQDVCEEWLISRHLSFIEIWYVLDDQYTSSMGTKFPIRWSAPEVFSYNRYSTKSDVWSFGVLMWEVFTEGKTPYENRTNAEVVEEVSAGFRLYKPRIASNTIYKLMQLCWNEKQNDRPPFSHLLYNLNEISDSDH
ncbi:hypothetical protein E2320_015325, partial [Naja naja]